MENKTGRITSFVCFDIETTGLNPLQDKMIEIGGLKVKEGKIIEQFIEFINPGIKLPAQIIKLTGIRDDMLTEADTEENVIRRFLEFTKDYIIMGHNIMFDYSFVKTAAKKLNLPFEKEGIDTLSISRKVLPNLKSKSLGNLCGHYGIINDHAHRAYDDAKATALLYVKLSNEYFDLYPQAFEAKLLNFKVKKQQSITKKQKIYLIDLLKYHKIDNVQEIDNLSQSEASRLIDRIIFNKGRMNET